MQPPVDRQRQVDSVSIDYEGRAFSIEFAHIGRNNPGPLIVFLHEGLGSLKAWKDFPSRLCETLRCRGVVYSRCGYGESSGSWAGESWPVSFMHVEAKEILPRFLAAIGVDAATDPPVLLGHSDGGSIALIYAASFPTAVDRIVVMAPHILVEEETVSGIARTQHRFMNSGLRARLGRYHRDVCATFFGWVGVWLDPQFQTWNLRSGLLQLRVPTLAIQGKQDEYGTMQQIDGIVGPGRHVHVVKLEQCGHAPQIDHPSVVIEEVGKFIAQSF